jgi:integrase
MLGEDFDMDTLTNSTFLDLIEIGRSRGMSNGTLNQYQVCLKTIVHALYKYGKIGSDNISITRLKEPRGREGFFTEQQVKEVINACKVLGTRSCDVVADVVKFAFLTGCRQSEALKLKWEHIDFEGNTLVFKDTKTDENRVLPLTAGLRTMLLELYDTAVEEYVFPIAQSTLHDNFVKAKDLAGIPSELVFHSLRHGAATMLFLNGCSLPTAKKILGHKRTETTLRYAKATDKAMETALQSLQF